MHYRECVVESFAQGSGCARIGGVQLAREILEEAPGACGVTRRVGLVHCLLHRSAHLLPQGIGDIAFLMLITNEHQRCWEPSLVPTCPRRAKSTRTDSCSKATFTYLVLRYFRKAIRST